MSFPHVSYRRTALAVSLLAAALGGSGAIAADLGIDAAEHATVAASAGTACGGECTTNNAAHYTYETLDYPGAADTVLWGINDFGAMTGQYNRSGLQAHAIVYRNGRFETPNPDGLLGDNFSAAGGPNDFGAIFIDYADGDASTPQHGLVMQWGQVEIVNFPGHLSSNVDGVSLSGAITGVYWDADQLKHGMLRRNGRDTPIDVAGARETYPLGNNSSGEIVGFWDTSSSDVHGFYRSLTGRISSFDVPNAGPGGTYAFGINDVGQIAGYYYDQSGGVHGYIEARGKFQTLDMPGAALTIATSINNFGVVVGEYYDAAFNTHGFIATPW